MAPNDGAPHLGDSSEDAQRGQLHEDVSWLRMRWRLAIAAVLAVALLVTIGLAWLVVSNDDRVLGATDGGPIAAGGLTEAELLAELDRYEEDLADRERLFAVEGSSFGVFGDEVGLAVDREATTQAALAVGRTDLWTTISTVLWRPNHQIEPVLVIDPGRLGAQVAEWNLSLARPFDGALTYDGGSLLLEPPRSGTTIDEAQLEPRVLAAFEGPPEDLLILNTEELAPAVSAESAAEALLQAEVLVAGDVILRSVDPAVAITFTPEQIGAALTTSVEASEMIVDLDPDVITTYLEPILNQIEAPAVDAQIVVTEADQVRIIPSRPGGTIDPRLVVNSILAASERTHRTARLVYVDSGQAAFTTADAEALGIKEMVSDFTTFHPCCQPRVTNIQRIADIVDGVIVMPGEEFDVNGFVGPRTREKGFVAAPMILAGKFVDSVGGGISQFATTLYNAVFFGGYTDVTHSPHSYYFSRYPEGREATVSFPLPDLIFRNDTDAALLIKTEYTDTSITVKFFGDNGGLDVQAGLSERSRFRSPVTEYQPDSSVPPGEERLVASGTTGWDVTVTRLITYPDGTTTTETWDERYRPQPRIVRRHPCSIPGAVQACPTTTTTTIPPVENGAP